MDRPFRIRSSWLALIAALTTHSACSDSAEDTANDDAATADGIGADSYVLGDGADSGTR